MKITAIANGSGEAGAMVGNVQVGQSASPERKERAKRILRGDAPVTANQSDTPTAPDLGRQHKRVLKMKTNHTPQTAQDIAQLMEPAPQNSPDSAQNLPQNSQADPANLELTDSTQQADATKPLSPQFAALAKQKRALQLKERELADRERALEAKATTGEASTQGVDLARIKSDPLSVLQEAGVSYQDLTDAILGNKSPQIDLKAFKEELLGAIDEKLNTNLESRDNQARKQVVAQMTREANYLVDQGETYELVRKTKSVPDAIDLIERTFDTTGEVLEVPEALRLVEEELVEEILAVAGASKIQGKLSPQASNPGGQPPQGQQMRTLTGRDNSGTRVLDRKQRAIAAFYGQKK